MSGNLKSLLFALALCIVCSLLLTAASSGLRPWQERNVLIDRHRNVLRAAGLLSVERDYSAADIERLYRERIRELQVDPVGRILERADSPKDAAGLPIYLSVAGEEILGYIVPIDARGLWGPIHAYLALERDGATVKGFAVYQHSETPGLGGEIEKRWFRDNWVGKKIVTREGQFVSVGIAKGRAEEAVSKEKQANYVDGISGATLTGKYLAAGIKDTLRRYEPVAVKFRKNLLTELGLPSPATLN
ncbi:MAG: FMN-binding protein [Desulfobacterales bacterium]|jgi:Na+-transporting NADH:ubiquinone oxidoreductase subunit C|nr:FMN-binding protein [Desulfobacterales bacterium]